ncbi:MAG: tetratricopeptide repeat protein [Deltaproteobacteria bacterium]|nr:tetratricopeptide repeat protein [Deltaproteobacteria bacterium]
MRIQFLSASLLALVACGGGSKSGGGGATGPKPPPPPSIGTHQDIATPGKGGTPAAPKVEVSKDAKADYKAAMDGFMANEKGGWNEGACRGSADKFSAVAREHKLVEAQFMVGLSLQRCGLDKDAESAYTEASHMKGDPAKVAMAVSSLGEIYYKRGQVDAAKQYWDTALKATGKLVGAHINEATMDLEQMRKIGNSKDATWKKLEEDAKFHLSSALGVDTDSVDAYTDFGLVWMEGWQQNKNRLDLAKTLLDEAKKRNEKYAPLQNAYGLYWMHKGSLNQALQAFTAAVEADPKFVEARINAGQLTLNFRKYDTAKEMFSKALEIAPKSYDATIGLGVALRGLNDFDGAEAQYNKAKGLDPRRGDAYFNLGVLYKDFRATKVNDPDPIKALRGSQDMYRKARDFFAQVQDKEADPSDKAEAKNNIGDCDKVIKQLDGAITSLQNAPKMPESPPPAPAGQGSGAPPAGAGSAAPPPAK